MLGIKILIVEDERFVALEVKNKIESLGFEVIGIVSSKLELIQFLQQQTPTLVLMDIDLGNADNGITLAKEVQENHNIPVVFLTGKEDSVIKQLAFNTKPADFLKKPLHLHDLKTRLELAVSKGTQHIKKELKNDAPIFIKNDSELIKLDPENIIRVEADGSYCKVYVQDIKPYYHKTISMHEFVSDLDQNKLIQVHKSHTVNIHSINKISGGVIHIHGCEVPIGRSFRDNLLDNLKSI